MHLRVFLVLICFGRGKDGSQMEKSPSTVLKRVF